MQQSSISKNEVPLGFLCSYLPRREIKWRDANPLKQFKDGWVGAWGRGWLAPVCDERVVGLGSLDPQPASEVLLLIPNVALSLSCVYRNDTFLSL